jgi:hypothetical protein
MTSHSKASASRSKPSIRNNFNASIPMAEFSYTLGTIYLDEKFTSLLTESLISSVNPIDDDDDKTQKSLKEREVTPVQQRYRRQDRVRSARSKIDELAMDKQDNNSVTGSIGMASQTSRSIKDYRRYHGRQKPKSGNNDGDSSFVSQKPAREGSRREPSLSSSAQLLNPIEKPNKSLILVQDSGVSAPPSPSPSASLISTGPGRIIQQLKVSSPVAATGIGLSWSSKDMLSGRDDLSSFSILDNGAADGGRDDTGGFIDTSGLGADQAKIGPGYVIYESRDLEKKK